MDQATQRIILKIVGFLHDMLDCSLLVYLFVRGFKEGEAIFFSYDVFSGERL